MGVRPRVKRKQDASITALTAAGGREERGGLRVLASCVVRGGQGRRAAATVGMPVAAAYAVDEQHEAEAQREGGTHLPMIVCVTCVAVPLVLARGVHTAAINQRGGVRAGCLARVPRLASMVGNGVKPHVHTLRYDNNEGGADQEAGAQDRHPPQPRSGVAAGRGVGGGQGRRGRVSRLPEDRGKRRNNPPLSPGKREAGEYKYKPPTPFGGFQEHEAQL